MLEETNHSGYINISRKYSCTKRSSSNAIDNGIEEPSLNLTRHYAYDFNTGEITIHAFESIPEIEGSSIILGYSYENKPCLFYSQLPVEMMIGWYPQNYRQKIDFIIQGYEVDSKFNEAVFSFDELQYFVPSSHIVTENEEGSIVFSRKSIEVKSFDICINSVLCHFTINLSSMGKYGLAHSNMEAVSEIRVSFPDTSDLQFLQRLYQIVDCSFAFICNRRNTTCLSMVLRGEYPSKTVKDGKVVDCVKPCKSEMYFFNKYRDEPEGEKVISKTWNSSYLLNRIDSLFQLMADALLTDTEESDVFSVASIHPSVKRRNLIDLQQSLQITGAFEMYVREYLPDMVEEKDYHIEMKEKLAEIEKNSTGKLKKLAKTLFDNVVREPALEDKVVKAYKGYGTWNPLQPCISDEWFKEDEIRDLGREANQWRNALAHSKTNYEPSERTIKAVRLIEHINYSIILRKLGYSDEEIREILENVLIR